MRNVYAGANVAKVGVPPAPDVRAPDVIIDTFPGVVVGGSAAKLCEHGGFNADDQSSGLLIMNPKVSMLPRLEVAFNPRLGLSYITVPD